MKSWPCFTGRRYISAVFGNDATRMRNARCVRACSAHSFASLRVLIRHTFVFARGGRGVAWVCRCIPSTVYHMLRLGAWSASPPPGARAIRIERISPLGSVSYASTSKRSACILFPVCVQRRGRLCRDKKEKRRKRKTPLERSLRREYNIIYRISRTWIIQVRIIERKRVRIKRERRGEI